MSLWSWLWPFGHKLKPEIAHTVEPGKSFSFGTNVGSPATGQKLPPEHHRYIRRDTKPVAVPYRSHDTNDNSATVAAVVLADPGSPIHHTPAYTPSHTPSYHDSGSHSHCDTGGYSGGFDGGGGGGGCDGGGGGH